MRQSLSPKQEPISDVAVRRPIEADARAYWASDQIARAAGPILGATSTEESAESLARYAGAMKQLFDTDRDDRLAPFRASEYCALRMSLIASTEITILDSRLISRLSGELKGKLAEQAAQLSPDNKEVLRTKVITNIDQPVIAGIVGSARTIEQFRQLLKRHAPSTKINAIGTNQNVGKIADQIFPEPEEVRKIREELAQLPDEQRVHVQFVIDHFSRYPFLFDKAVDAGACDSLVKT